MTREASGEPSETEALDERPALATQARMESIDEAEAPAPDTVHVDPADARFETADDPRIPEGKLFFKIGEVAKITGLKPYVLRYWETEFPWIRPSKTSSRQRLYRRQDIAVLLQIKRLRYQERQTIADTKELIREHRGVERGRRPARPTARRSSAPSEPSPMVGGGAAERLVRGGQLGLGLGFTSVGPSADLAPMLADMRKAVLDLLEAVED